MRLPIFQLKPYLQNTNQLLRHLRHLVLMFTNWHRNKKKEKKKRIMVIRVELMMIPKLIFPESTLICLGIFSLELRVMVRVIFRSFLQRPPMILLMKLMRMRSINIKI